MHSNEPRTEDSPDMSKMNWHTAVIYLRISKDGGDDSLGLEAQRSQCEDWCRRNKFRILHVAVDQGQSGSNTIEDRAGLVEALAHVRQDKPDVLLVAKRDRLARDVYIAGTIERECKKAGALIKCADGTANGDSAADAFMRAILDAVAAFERDMIVARTKAALKAKRDRGERTGGIPFGMRLAPDGKTLYPEPLEQAVIALVVRCRAEGRSYYAITRELAAMGMKTRKGGALLRNQLVRIMEAHEKLTEAAA